MTNTERWAALALAATLIASTSVATAVAQPAAPKQAVFETSAGTFVLDLLPETAPNTVAFFTKTVQSGGYDGTAFHRAIRNGMVQGGDPLSKDPAKKAQYGQGGLNQVKAEARAAKVTGGAVASVLVPGQPDSAGMQFFVLLADQPGLANQYTIFAQVADGMDVLQKISAMPLDAGGMLVDRVEVKKAVIRDRPPDVPEPYVNDSPEQLKQYRAVLETSAGPITIELFADKAPETVRQFLRLAEAGVYNDMAFHRVAPGFVIQTGALASRSAPLNPKQQALVHDLQPELNDTKHVKGIVSMARGDSPTSAQTSFFVCVGTSTALDGVYTAFGRVVDGMSAVDAIEQTPRTGETPNARIDLKTVRIVKN
jgi:peptidyl-prolyl cis-trans isomerase B (cyclophilin B)